MRLDWRSYKSTILIGWDSIEGQLKLCTSFFWAAMKVHEFWHKCHLSISSHGKVCWQNQQILEKHVNNIFWHGCNLITSRQWIPQEGTCLIWLLNVWFLNQNLFCSTNCYHNSRWTFLEWMFSSRLFLYLDKSVR